MKEPDEQGLTAQLLDGGPLLRLLPGLCQILVRSPHCVEEQADAVLQKQTQTLSRKEIPAIRD